MPPETIIGYNKPYHFINKTVWVTSNTTIFLKTDDKPMCACGVNNTQYRIDNGKWKMYSQPFRVTGECVHIIQYYSIDNLNNKEKTKSQIVYVDNTPPETTLEIKGSHVGDPFTSKPFFVTTNTHFLLHSKDNQSECNVGARNIYYRIWNIYSGWSNWSIYQDGPFSTPGFTLKEECLHYIEYYSDDYLGNKETVHNISCYVDNTPPTTIGYG
ncbi:MAG TPA: hypothetical protein ENI42_02825, partial [Thermoplasmatales archaeon]|nr:hypothetical protein [Thermoplasmatales archaeon]